MCPCPAPHAAKTERKALKIVLHSILKQSILFIFSRINVNGNREALLFRACALSTKRSETERPFALMAQD